MTGRRDGHVARLTPGDVVVKMYGDRVYVL
jgi:hypothetical protein